MKEKKLEEKITRRPDLSYGGAKTQLSYQEQRVRRVRNQRKEKKRGRGKAIRLGKNRQNNKDFRRSPSVPWSQGPGERSQPWEKSGQIARRRSSRHKGAVTSVGILPCWGKERVFFQMKKGGRYKSIARRSSGKKKGGKGSKKTMYRSAPLRECIGSQADISLQRGNSLFWGKGEEDRRRKRSKITKLGNAGRREVACDRNRRIGKSRGGGKKGPSNPGFSTRRKGNFDLANQPGKKRGDAGGGRKAIELATINPRDSTQSSAPRTWGGTRPL